MDKVLGLRLDKTYDVAVTDNAQLGGFSGFVRSQWPATCLLHVAYCAGNQIFPAIQLRKIFIAYSLLVLQ